jgi:hypothetical protein
LVATLAATIVTGTTGYGDFVGVEWKAGSITRPALMATTLPFVFRMANTARFMTATTYGYAQVWREIWREGPEKLQKIV